MIRRKTYEKLPLQGNVYPMPTMAYIEDDSMRFTVLAGQPSGVACLKPGKTILSSSRHQRSIEIEIALLFSN